MILPKQLYLLTNKKREFQKTLFYFFFFYRQRAKPCFTLSRSSAALALLKRSSVPTK